MRICHVLARLDVGGLENGVVNLCNGIDRTRFVPFICCLRAGGPMAQRLAPDVAVHVLSFPGGAYPFRFLRLARYFRRTRPDVVHTHSWGQGSFDGILAARVAGVPTIVNGEHGTFFTRRHQVHLQRFLSRRCSTTLSVSHAHEQQVVEVLGISPERIRVIHNGVDTARFSGAYDTRALVAELRRTSGVPVGQGAFVIGCVGRLAKVKNQQLLVRAAAWLQRNGAPDAFVVVVVGSGPDLQALRQLAADLGVERRVEFAGERRDVPELLSLMNVLVLPSETGMEGLPNAVLEAMASGVPVVSTPSVGVSEVITDGRTGCVLLSDDPAELGAALRRFVERPADARAMGAAARAHVGALVNCADDLGTRTCPSVTQRPAACAPSAGPRSCSPRSRRTRPRRRTPRAGARPVRSRRPGNRGAGPAR